MQKITAYLIANSTVATVCDYAGQSNTPKPIFTRGTRAILELVLFKDETPTPIDGDLGDYVSWDFVAANDWLTNTDPQLHVTSGITASENIITIPLNDINTAELIAAMANNSSIPLGCELAGFEAGETLPSFLIQFDIEVRNRRGNAGTGTPTTVEDGQYTAAQVDALVVGLENKIKAANVYQYSADGETWHDAPRVSTDTVYHERKNVEGSLYGASLPLPRAELIIDTKTYNFSTTAESTNPLVISKETLGIASDAEPQISVWLINGDGSKQLAGDSVIPVKSYTADGTGLSLTYYQTTWPVANWQIKMS